MSVFSHAEFNAHEQVVFVEDKASGLRAIIAVHDTRLGAAVGGCRMYPYHSDTDALTDALRLSRGMTYKSALAGLPFGGGKSVILGDPRHQKSPELLRAMGRAVEGLSGSYIIAEDSGTSPEDMRIIAEATSHVTGGDGIETREDPSPATAWGVFQGIQAGARMTFGNDALEGKRVAIQGLGHVGYHLARHLIEAGATVLGSDINPSNLVKAATDLGVTPVSARDILFQPCDILAPCAMGGILSEFSIPNIQARVIAGAANNQLATDQDDQRLRARGILYCPDFAINAGGVIDIFHQQRGATHDARREAVNRIGSTIELILERAAETGAGTQHVAQYMAEERIPGQPVSSTEHRLRGAA